MGELRGESETHTHTGVGWGGGFSVIEHMGMFMQENDSHNSKHMSDQPLLLMLPHFVGDFETTCRDDGIMGSFCSAGELFDK